MKEFPEDFKVKDVPPDPKLNLGVSEEEGGEAETEIEESPLLKIGGITIENTEARKKKIEKAEAFAKEQLEKRNQRRNIKSDRGKVKKGQEENISTNYERAEDADDLTEKVTSVTYKADARKWNPIINQKNSRLGQQEKKDAVNKREFYNNEEENLTEELGKETTTDKNLLTDGFEVLEKYDRETSEKKPITFNEIKRKGLQKEIGKKEEGLSSHETRLVSQENYKKNKAWEKHFTSEAVRDTKPEAEELFGGDGFSIYGSKDARNKDLEDLPNHDLTPWIEDNDLQLLVLLKEQLKDAQASGSRTDIESIIKEIDKINDRNRKPSIVKRVTNFFRGKTDTGKNTQAQSPEVKKVTVTPVDGEIWGRVLELATSENINDRKHAILEADILLGEVLQEYGYKEKSLGEKILQARKDGLDMRDASHAHTIRNKIAHLGAKYAISSKEAYEVIKMYEKSFAILGAKPEVAKEKTKDAPVKKEKDIKIEKAKSKHGPLEKENKNSRKEELERKIFEGQKEKVTDESKITKKVAKKQKVEKSSPVKEKNDENISPEEKRRNELLDKYNI